MGHAPRMFSLRVSGGLVYTDGLLLARDILVSGEKIADLVRSGQPAAAERVLRADGRLVLPAMIDMHVHARDPGYTYKEDYRSMSEAAAAGGVSMVVDMPNVEPPTLSPEDLQDKQAIASARSIVDVAHWCSGVNEDQIEPLAAAGAAGFKIVQLSGEYPRDPRLSCNDDGRLLRLFRRIAATGLPCVVHPFNQRLYDQLVADLRAEGVPPDWRALSRVYTTSAIWDSAVASLLALQELTGVRLHVAHLHSAHAIEMVRRAKQEGRAVTAEIDPKYYTLSLDDLERLHGRACPAGYVASDEARMAAIREALLDGTIDNVSSDHAPHTAEEIKLLEGDAFLAAAGLPMLDVTFMLVLDDYVSGLLPIQRVVELVASAPAAILGIADRKGRLAVGMDADLVVVDTSSPHVIRDSDVRSKVGWTPYDGRVVGARIEACVRRGEIIARDRQVVSDATTGQEVLDPRPALRAKGLEPTT